MKDRIGSVCTDEHLQGTIVAVEEMRRLCGDFKRSGTINKEKLESVVKKMLTKHMPE